MGIETVALLTLTAVKGFAGISTANKEAKQENRAAEQGAKNRALKARVQADATKMSFLNSGVELEGTPAAAISNIFNVGIKDTQNILSNADSKSKALVSGARNKMLFDFAGIGMKGGFGGTGTTTNQSQTDASLPWSSQALPWRK